MAARSEASGKLSVSLGGPRLTVRDCSAGRALLEMVWTTRTLSTCLVEGLRRVESPSIPSVPAEAQVLLQAVSVAALSGPRWEWGPCRLLKDSVRPPASAVSVCRVEASGVSRETRLFLGVRTDVLSLEVTAVTFP